MSPKSCPAGAFGSLAPCKPNDRTEPKCSGLEVAMPVYRQSEAWGGRACYASVASRWTHVADDAVPCRVAKFSLNAAFLGIAGAEEERSFGMLQAPAIGKRTCTERS